MGNAGTAKRRKLQAIADDMVVAGANTADATQSSELLEADRELLASFETRLAELKVLDPPVADGPFKSYLTDVVTKLTGLKGEFKTKRRSAVRRTLKELDPLALALVELGDKADALTHVFKCYSSL